jgi:hypothetical protein
MAKQPATPALINRVLRARDASRFVTTFIENLLIEKLQCRVVIVESADMKRYIPTDISSQIGRQLAIEECEKCLFLRLRATQLRRKKNAVHGEAMNRIQHSGVKSYVD